MSYKVIIAVDIGTAYTKVAFRRSTDLSEPIVYDKWLGLDSNNSCLAPTAVLYRRNSDRFSGRLTERRWIMESFGKSAISGYRADRSERGTSRVLLYSNFKMVLHELEEFDESMEITSDNAIIEEKGSSPKPHPMKALDIFSDILIHIEKRIVDHVEVTFSLSLLKDDIQWILTVPAIWSVSARNFMRQAARKANIHDGKKGDSLLLALEPESAALHLRDEFQKNRLAPHLCNATKYSTIDCGGGTIDVATHKVEKDGLSGQTLVYDLHRPAGNDLGSHRINERFFSFLCSYKTLPRVAEFMSYMRAQFPQHWRGLNDSFEEKKVDWDGQTNLKVQLHESFFMRYDIKYDEDNGLSKMLENQNRDIFIQEDTSLLVIANHIVKSWFNNLVDNIISEVQDLDVQHNLEGIFIVGGFSQCRLLQSRLTSTFGVEKIAMPVHASLSVVQGAAKYGPNPRALKSRKSPATYGIEVVEKFKVGDPHMIKKSTGEEYCDKIFRKYITIDQSMSTDMPIEHRFTPFEISSDRFSVSVYASSTKNPRYTTDRSCYKLAVFTVPLPPNLCLEENRKIYITFDFSGPELHIHATEDSGQFYGDSSVEFVPVDACRQRTRQLRI